MAQTDFFSEYMKYSDGNEVHKVYHRWSAITGLGALLERNVFYPFGTSCIYPNLYVMFMGITGARKTTAINMIVKVLREAGYSTFAAEKTSKEKFLMDLGKQGVSDDDALFGANTGKVTPILVAAGEANDFFGINNTDFLSILGSLWECPDKYENKIKTGPSDWINGPTISILSANTPTNFTLAFPPAIVGQGFFGRLLLIHGEPAGVKIRKPKRPSPEETAYIVEILRTIRSSIFGELECTSAADKLLDDIYDQYNPPVDHRFEAYFSRRYTMLMKICMIVAAGKLEREITESTVVQANTYLTFAEQYMSKALGEFGKSKDSDVTHKVLKVIEESTLPMTVKDIFKQVHQDLDGGMPSLGKILQNLSFADKIQSVHTGNIAGWLPKREVINEDLEAKGFVAFKEYLTRQELELKK